MLRVRVTGAHDAIIMVERVVVIAIVFRLLQMKAPLVKVLGVGALVPCLCTCTGQMGGHFKFLTHERMHKKHFT